MESRDTDDWVDKLMLFFANNSKPVAEEWFKLCSWFLILSALSFLSEVGRHVAFDIALGISMVIMWIYFMFHYQKIWYHKYNKTVDGKPSWGSGRRLFFHFSGFMVTLFVASCMLNLAMLFGSEAASFLHSTKG